DTGRGRGGGRRRRGCGGGGRRRRARGHPGVVGLVLVDDRGGRRGHEQGGDQRRQHGHGPAGDGRGGHPTTLGQIGDHTGAPTRKREGWLPSLFRRSCSGLLGGQLLHRRG